MEQICFPHRSERVAKTGVNGLLLTEAKYINLSLHYLEQVSQFYQTWINFQIVLSLVSTQRQFLNPLSVLGKTAVFNQRIR